MFRIYLRDGFEGQVHFVVPRPFLSQVENHPLLHALFPTDIGWYPHARYHYRERREGAPEHILIYCVGGSGSLQIQEKTYPVEPENAILIPSGTPHIYSASLDDPWSIHWIHFRGETAYQFAQQMPEGQYCVKVHPQAHLPIVETFQECYDALASDFGMTQMIFCAMSIHRILAWIFFRNPAFQPETVSIPTSVKKALKFMHENLHQRPSLPMVADHTGMSVSHFSYQFRSYMGVSPIDYFINLKMQYACHLLETSEMPVKNIALAVGYEDAYYFSRLFRKIIGASPINYRKKVDRHI